MSLMNNLKTKDNVESIDEDRVGGGSGLWETDVYASTIKYAYLGQSKGGAISLNLQLENDDKQVTTQTIYMTSKSGSNTYQDKKTGKDKYLPGFMLGNTLALLTVGKEIGDLEPEEKVIKLYSFEEKKEVNTQVQMLTDLVGERIIAAVEKQTVDKKVKNDAGNYVANGETREQNEIAKFFRERDKMTAVEISGQAEEATFIHVWTEKFKGEVINRAKGADKSSGATKGAPGKPAGAAKGGVKSLFN